MGSFSSVGEHFSEDRSVLLGPAPAGAQALECYSCVQKADDGCSPQKMKTVKCAPGVDVCTEAVGAVETSECDPEVLEHPPRAPAGPRLLTAPPIPATPLLLGPAPPIHPGRDPSAQPLPSFQGIIEVCVGRCELGAAGTICVWDEATFSTQVLQNPPLPPCPAQIPLFNGSLSRRGSSKRDL